MINSFPVKYNTSAVSEKQFLAHKTLYEGYVSKTNEISQILESAPGLDDANAVYSKYRGLKEAQSFALNGVILHEEYFKNMTASKMIPGKKTLEVFNNFFGGRENFFRDFEACAKSARGWCMLVYEQRTNSFVNIMLDAHNLGNVCSAFPLLVLDMYEHAYFMDYGTDKGKYIGNFAESIDWETVESRVNITERLFG